MNIKKTLFSLTAVIAVTFTMLAAPVFVQGQDEIDVAAKEIEYTLPYPGILPDSPLYPVKILRDRFWLFFTRDNAKKAELLLLFSDKKIVMAQALSEKGKWDLATDILLESEKDFKKLVEFVDLSRTQGVDPGGDFILEAKLSNEKHRETIENILSDTPQGERTQLEESITLNDEVKELLEKL